jgi:hypothetical protein
MLRPTPPFAALLVAGALTAACDAKVDVDTTKASAPTQAEASGSTGGDWSEAGKPSGATAKGEAPGTRVAISADRATGAVKLAFPGARMEFNLPESMLKAQDFELDGTKLYPGSVIDTFDVRRREGEGNDTVRIAFTSPAAPDVVRGWMLSQTASAKRPLRATSEALVGATGEGKAYTIRLAPGATAGETKGVILVVS